MQLLYAQVDTARRKSDAMPEVWEPGWKQTYQKITC